MLLSGCGHELAKTEVRTEPEAKRALHGLGKLYLEKYRGAVACRTASIEALGVEVADRYCRVAEGANFYGRRFASARQFARHSVV